eukprot:gnl/MRDRNA2_/MRDRNA2_135515_c0_seq1.p1 gnl/MRDRNA2_/MRDRNA2_135515_c0~~gnl/MRDRNA2_/MRDRNA2_135515_c0_seq1.p1  ORF type:complete len:252 (+),score=51.65 gnl/MRDRNA2_/MRDRNA2_135515_c0_seq1:97-852(+)
MVETKSQARAKRREKAETVLGCILKRLDSLDNHMRTMNSNGRTACSLSDRVHALEMELMTQKTINLSMEFQINQLMVLQHPVMSQSTVPCVLTCEAATQYDFVAQVPAVDPKSELGEAQSPWSEVGIDHEVKLQELEQHVSELRSSGIRNRLSTAEFEVKGNSKQQLQQHNEKGAKVIENPSFHEKLKLLEKAMLGKMPLDDDLLDDRLLRLETALSLKGLGKGNSQEARLLQIQTAWNQQAFRKGKGKIV